MPVIESANLTPAAMGSTVAVGSTVPAEFI